MNQHTTPPLSCAHLALRGLAAAMALSLGGCNATLSSIKDIGPLRALMPEIRQVLNGAATTAAPAAAAASSSETATVPALVPASVPAPPVQLITEAMPDRKQTRFDLNVASVNATALFAAIAHDSRLSVMVDPRVKGSYTMALKEVTLGEALESLQELYGFDYKVVGRKLLVQPAEPQTRVFQVNYPAISRSGRTDVRVVSGSISQGSGNGQNASTGNGTSAANGGGGVGTGGGGGGGGTQESSRISTAQRSDLWAELESAIKLLAPDKDSTQVVVSPQTGTVIVRAMPATLRAIEKYLDAAKLQVERQVMIEAKIIEVSLNDGASAGINWAAFKNALSTRVSAGLLSPGVNLSTSGPLVSGSLTAQPGTAISAAESLAGGLLGLAFQTSNFAAVLSFLESQGSLQVLSSPRIATLNNQKAVLKVGSDDFFVTNISTTTSSTGNSSTTSPTISVQPFFSGISLDVTPQIDEGNSIILHVHPQVTTVKERAKLLNLGSLGSFTLPLASSSVNESDSIVRVSSGTIFAIGGLMRSEQSDERSGVPGTGNTGLRYLFGQSSRSSNKQELVILLKPTIIAHGDEAAPSRDQSLARMLAWLEEAR